MSATPLDHTLHEGRGPVCVWSPLPSCLLNAQRTAGSLQGPGGKSRCASPPPSLPGHSQEPLSRPLHLATLPRQRLPTRQCLLRCGSPRIGARLIKLCLPCVWHRTRYLALKKWWMDGRRERRQRMYMDDWEDGCIGSGEGEREGNEGEKMGGCVGFGVRCKSSSFL